MDGELTARPPVLVCGGGIAGLAAAVALHRRGIATTVFERRRERSDDGLGLNLPGNAVAALVQLGLGDRLQTLGIPTRCREYRSARDRLLFDVDEVAFWGASRQPRCVLRGELVAALLARLPPGTVRAGVGVRAMRRTGTAVELTLDTGERVCGDAVIGADGVRSTIRAQVAGRRLPRASLISGTSWRFVTDDLGVRCWTAWTGRAGTALLIPVAEGRCYGWLAPRDHRSPELFSQATPVFEQFPALVRQTLARAAHETRPPYLAPLEEIRPAAWTPGRVILIGDAAHATAPVWAQGAALAIEDALVVADVLGDHDWSRAGETVARRRRNRVAHVQRMTDRMSRTARLPSWLLDLAAPRVGPRNYRQTYAPLRTAEL
ncbi:MAG TPA: FAD-dependent monooxygenase [Microlunatus sp.]|nr:FAD-dependent monooxygenase [Microlunatus sp.]